MAKIKFALLKDVPKLPDISVMKEALKVKKICCALSFAKKPVAWVDIKDKYTFGSEVLSDYEKLFNVKINGSTELYAFSSDANSTMLGLIYPKNVVAMFEADDVDAQGYMDAHWTIFRLDRLSQCYDNVEEIKFVIDTFKFSESQVNELKGFKLIDKKQYNFVKGLREAYYDKMRLIYSNAWS